MAKDSGNGEELDHNLSHTNTCQASHIALLQFASTTAVDSSKITGSSKRLHKLQLSLLGRVCCNVNRQHALTHASAEFIEA